MDSPPASDFHGGSTMVVESDFPFVPEGVEADVLCCSPPFSDASEGLELLMGPYPDPSDVEPEHVGSPAPVGECMEADCAGSPAEYVGSPAPMEAECASSPEHASAPPPPAEVAQPTAASSRTKRTRDTKKSALEAKPKAKARAKNAAKSKAKAKACAKKAAEDKSKSKSHRKGKASTSPKAKASPKAMAKRNDPVHKKLHSVSRLK